MTCLKSVSDCRLSEVGQQKVSKTHGTQEKVDRYLNTLPTNGPYTRGLCIIFHISSVKKYVECSFWYDTGDYGSKKGRQWTKKQEYSDPL